jgi:hypothetical protein
MRDLVPGPPSSYCRKNYFLGASLQSRADAEAAIRDGYTDNVLWGSDYLSRPIEERPSHLGLAFRESAYYS